MTTPAMQLRLLASGRAFILTMAMMALAACGESPTGPRQSIDRVAAERVVPAVTDARVRLAAGIDNAVVRDRLRHDLAELEGALMNGDGNKVRFHLRIVETVTSDYREQEGTTTTDGPEICAVQLMVTAVRRAIDGAP